LWLNKERARIISKEVSKEVSREVSKEVSKEIPRAGLEAPTRNGGILARSENASGLRLLKNYKTPGSLEPRPPAPYLACVNNNGASSSSRATNASVIKVQQRVAQENEKERGRGSDSVNGPPGNKGPGPEMSAIRVSGRESTAVCRKERLHVVIIAARRLPARRKLSSVMGR
jgi:hypothetical protein